MKSCNSLDPRIKRIKQQEKDAREAKKRAATGSGTSTPRKTKAEEEAEKKRSEEEAQKKEEAEKVCLSFFLRQFSIRCVLAGRTSRHQKAKTGGC